MQVKGWQGSAELNGAVVTVRRWMRGSTTIPVDRITAIEIVRAGVGFRAIRFNVAGGTVEARRASPLGSYTAALRDPYSVLFRSGRLGEFEAFRDAVQRSG